MILSFLRAYLFSKRSQSHIKKMARISLGGIFLGSFSLIVVLSIMSGLNASTEERLLRNEPHLVIKSDKNHSPKKILNFLSQVSWKDKILRSNNFETQDVLIRTDEGYFNGAEALGLKSKAFKTKNYFRDSLGDPLLHDLDLFLSGENVFIGPDLAYELKIVVGDVIELYKPESILASQTKLSAGISKSVTVLGILNTEGGEQESRLLVYPFGGLFQGRSLSKVQGQELYFINPQKIGTYKKSLLEDDFKVETWKDRNSSLFIALKLEKISMTFLLGLALLITSFSIMSLLILIIVQKQKDIGILLSMGLSVKKIRFIFGGMGGALSVAGLLSGLSLGMIVSLLLEAFPLKILPPIYQDPYLPAKFNLQTFLWVLFFCILVSVLSSVIPIVYLSKVKPVKALNG